MSKFKNKKYLNLQSALAFESSQYLEIEDSTPIDSNTFTISILARFSSVNDSVGDYLLWKGQTAGTNHSFFLRRDALGTITFSINNGGTTITSAKVNSDVWVHLIAVATSTDIYLYVNGRLAASSANAITPDSENLRIAFYPTPDTSNKSFVGQAAYLRIFDKALNLTEIESLHTFLTVVPDTAREAVVYEFSLQYNTYRNMLRFTNDGVASGGNVNQVAHGFAVGDCVVLDGTYRFAVHADVGVLVLNAVITVTGPDDFTPVPITNTAGQAGRVTWTSGFAAGSILYLDNSGATGNITDTVSDYPQAVVISTTTVQFYQDGGNDYMIGSTTQYNIDIAAPSVTDDEVFALMSGFTAAQSEYDDKNGLPVPYDYSHKDIYGVGVKTEPTAKVYDGTTDSNEIVSFVWPNNATAYSIGITFDLDTVKECGFLHFPTPVPAFDLMITSTDKIKFNLQGGVSPDILEVDSIESITVGIHTLVITMDGTATAAGLEMYLDGVQLGKTIVTNGLTTECGGAINTFIADRPSVASNEFDGKISALQIISGAADQVDVDYFAKFGVFSSGGDLLDIDFDKTSGNPITTKAGTPTYTINTTGANNYSTILLDTDFPNKGVYRNSVKYIAGATPTTADWDSIPSVSLNPTNSYTWLGSYKVLENNPATYNFDFGFYVGPSTASPFLSMWGGYTWCLLWLRDPTTTFNNYAQYNFPNAPLPIGTEVCFVVKQNGRNPQNWQVFVNGGEVVPVKSGTGSGSTTFNGLHINRHVDNGFNDSDPCELYAAELVTGLVPDSICEQASSLDRRTFTGLIPEADFEFRANIDKDPVTKNITDSSLNAHTVTRQNTGTNGDPEFDIYSEFKSEYHAHKQGLFIDGTSKKVLLDTTNLPTASDSYTIHLLCYVDWTRLEDFHMLYKLGSSTVGTEPEIYARKGFGINNVDWYNRATTPQGFNNTDHRLLNNIFALTVVVNNDNNTTRWYVNGHFRTQNTFASADNLSALTNPEFAIGNHTLVPGGTSGTNMKLIACGYGRRALSNAEVMHLYGNGFGNNPWTRFPIDFMRSSNGDAQADWDIFHVFTENNIYDDGSVKCKNLADPSGATDAVISGYTNLADVIANLTEIRQLKREKIVDGPVA